MFVHVHVYLGYTYVVVFLEAVLIWLFILGVGVCIHVLCGESVCVSAMFEFMGACYVCVVLWWQLHVCGCTCV